MFYNTALAHDDTKKAYYIGKFPADTTINIQAELEAKGLSKRIDYSKLSASDFVITQYNYVQSSLNVQGSMQGSGIASVGTSAPYLSYINGAGELCINRGNISLSTNFGQAESFTTNHVIYLII